MCVLVSIVLGLLLGSGLVLAVVQSRFALGWSGVLVGALFGLRFRWWLWLG